MRAYILIYVVLLICIALLWWGLLQRAGSAVGLNDSLWMVRLLPVVAAMGLTLLSANPGRVHAVFLLHVVMMEGLFLPAALLWRALMREEPSFLRPIAALYRCGALPVLLASVLLLYGWWNMYQIEQTAYTVYTEKDIRPEGYRVALISDVHYGVSLHREQLRAVCADVTAAAPDLVILGGDLVDSSTTRQGMEELFAELAAIESPLGSYYVYGNHDRPRPGQDFTAEQLRAAIQQNGIAILQDEALPLAADLLLTGREDRSTGDRLPLQEIFAGHDPAKFLLVIDHQPTGYAENAAAGTDLLLSGHSHGGQLWPINWIDRFFQINDHNYGHTTVGPTQAIVSSGLAGWQYPLKTSAPAEYVVIDILPAPPSA